MQDSEGASVPDDHLTSVLDSFYSDIAAISTDSTSNVIPEIATLPAVADTPVSEQVKKKKKAKVSAFHKQKSNIYCLNVFLFR